MGEMGEDQMANISECGGKGDGGYKSEYLNLVGCWFLVACLQALSEDFTMMLPLVQNRICCQWLTLSKLGCS